MDGISSSHSDEYEDISRLVDCAEIVTATACRTSTVQQERAWSMADWRLEVLTAVLVKMAVF
jgi:hypothetical protein